MIGAESAGLHWVSNAPGSTLFMPVGDASAQLLGLLAIFAGSDYLIVDDLAQRPAGNLSPFVRSGLLDEAKPFPLTFLEQLTYGMNCMELAFMGHKMVLTMQGIGLGG